MVLVPDQQPEIVKGKIMREDTVTTKVYSFDELSDGAKEKVIEELSNINVDYEWCDGIYEDAKIIGLEITEFDLGRGAFCRGNWTEDAEETAQLILKEHGETCETHKNATEFTNAVGVQGSIFEGQDDYDADDDGPFDESDQYGEICEEFQQTICEDYRIILQKEYEYLISKKAIIETIETNGYEFTADGKLY